MGRRAVLQTLLLPVICNLMPVCCNLMPLPSIKLQFVQLGISGSTKSKSKLTCRGFICNKSKQKLFSQSKEPKVFSVFCLYFILCFCTALHMFLPIFLQKIAKLLVKRKQYFLQYISANICQKICGIFCIAYNSANICSHICRIVALRKYYLHNMICSIFVECKDTKKLQKNYGSYMTPRPLHPLRPPHPLLPILPLRPFCTFIPFAPFVPFVPSSHLVLGNLTHML